MTGSQAEYRFWETGPWTPVGSPILRDRANLRGPLAFAPDGSVLAIAHSPKDVRLVDPATGRELATLTAPDRRLVSWLRFSPDGSRLAVACESQVIQLWDLRLIRGRLKAMGLDWGTLMLPPAVGTVGPCAVRVQAAEPRPALERPERERRWAEVVARLDGMIDREPEEWSHYCRRGDARAELSEWDRAVADFSQAIEVGAGWEDASAWSRLALAQLAAGNEAGYRNSGEAMLRRFGQSGERNLVIELAWIQVLSPVQAAVDVARTVELLKSAVATAPRDPIVLGILGAAAYRLGRYEEAIGYLNESNRAHSDGGLVWNWLFLAMAHHRLGQDREASTWIDRASGRVGRGGLESPREPSNGRSMRWAEQLVLRRLFREARQSLDHD